MLRGRRIPGRPRLVSSPRANPMNLPIPQGETFRANRSVVSRNKQGKISHLPRPGWWKTGTCEDIACEKYLYGWVSVLSVTANAQMVDAIRRYGGWEYRESMIGPDLIQFVFPPGQTCSDHLMGTGVRVGVERDPIFLHRSGARQRALDYDEFWYRFQDADEMRQRKLKEG